MEDPDVTHFMNIIEKQNEKYRNVVFLPPTPEEIRRQLIGEVVATLEFKMLDGKSFDDAVQEIRAIYSAKDLEQRFILKGGSAE